MSDWNASNYKRRKAQRQAERPAQWFTNPETEEKFFIRPAGAVASLLAQSLPSALKETALDGWKEHGIEVESSGEPTQVLTRTAEEAEHINQMSARLIYEACLIPTLTAIGESVESIQERALRNCEVAFANDQSWKSATDEEKRQRASEVVLPLAELDESDAKFILRQAYTYIGTVPLQGGRVTNVTDLKSLRKTPGRRARTGTSG